MKLPICEKGKTKCLFLYLQTKSTTLIVFLLFQYKHSNSDYYSYYINFPPFSLDIIYI